MATAKHPAGLAPLIETSIDIAAPPAQVWTVVSDPVAIGRLSPQVVRTLVHGKGPVRVGTQAHNLNRRGVLVWPTRSKVIAMEAERRFAFRVKDNASIWSFTLEPIPEGTRVVHRREMPQGTTPISALLTDKVLGGQSGFTEELRAGMGRTLERLKRQVESGA